jgi:hypothetical protein
MCGSVIQIISRRSLQDLQQRDYGKSSSSDPKTNCKPSSRWISEFKIHADLENVPVTGEITITGDILYCLHPVVYYSYLWLYSPLLGLGSFPVPSSYTQSVGLLGRGISPSQGLYLYTEQHKYKINTHRHPSVLLTFRPADNIKTFSTYLF